MICLDELLTGTPTREQVSEYFRKGEFYEEKYLVEAIEKHLLTEGQRQLMFQHRLSIEKILNGRFNGEQEPTVTLITDQWNETLGFMKFGF